MGFSLVVILLLLSLSKGLGGSCGWDRGLGRLSCSALTINDSRHDNLTQVLLSQFRGDVSTRTSTHETICTSSINTILPICPMPILDCVNSLG